MHYSAAKSYLVIIGADVILYKFRVSLEGLQQERKTKLAVKGDAADLQVVWAGGGLLAATNREGMVRMWHVEQDCNYMLLLNGMCGVACVVH